jgi:hypothetical protein
MEANTMSWDEYEFDALGHFSPRSVRELGPGMGWVHPDRPDNRTKQQSPYAYSPFYHWREAGSDKDTSAYSDRLAQWKHDEWRAACGKLPPGQFQYQTPDALSALMSEYEGKPVRVTALAEGCNVSNGYPYYIFWWRDAKPNRAARKCNEN